jgi:Protein of unknown function (DUF2752)
MDQNRIGERRCAQRRLRRTVSTAGLGATAVAMSMANLPFAPRCPVHAATGVWCPGCGTTRAVAAVVRLDLPAAIGSQPLLPLATLVAVVAVVRRRRGDPILSRRGFGAVAAVLVVFTVARNLPLPVAELLAPP